MSPPELGLPSIYHISLHFSMGNRQTEQTSNANSELADFGRTWCRKWLQTMGWRDMMKKTTKIDGARCVESGDESMQQLFAEVPRGVFLQSWMMKSWQSEKKRSNKMRRRIRSLRGTTDTPNRCQKHTRHPCFRYRFLRNRWLP